MKTGVFYFPTDYGIQPGELAKALEDRGFESLFVCEHTHIPVSRRSPFPGGWRLQAGGFALPSVTVGSPGPARP